MKEGAVHNIEYADVASGGVRYAGNALSVGYERKSSASEGYESSGNSGNYANEGEVNWAAAKNDGVPNSRGDVWDQDHH